MTWKDDCVHAVWYKESVPYGDGYTTRQFLECRLGIDNCVDCDDYEGTGSIDVRVTSPYDCDLEDC